MTFRIAKMDNFTLHNYVLQGREEICQEVAHKKPEIRPPQFTEHKDHDKAQRKSNRLAEKRQAPTRSH
jgi:hypothetical protein